MDIPDAKFLFFLVFFSFFFAYKKRFYPGWAVSKFNMLSYTYIYIKINKENSIYTTF